ncbi:MAG: 3-methyl-2-oxobutanoate hydroxymethyltransferase [Dehalococcoidia bacterium]|jgi:3-methyl-2-oxobutanoate hydroxymethyltransferase|nr:3-methyl-2-oxobutanoate hydroxymethyltransferase [Dehalococcoidia bacterium]
MRITISDIREMKSKGEKIPMLTAYDYTSASIVDAAGVPVILVGDTLGQVVLGYDSTLPVTMDEMIHHTKAVARGTKRALIVGDMPFMSYQASITEAMHNAGRFLQEGGAQTVKLEGGVNMAPTVRHMVSSGIPVMGHIGLTPQSVNQMGGYKVQGRSLKAAVHLMEDARALEEAGAFAMVLECVPASLAKLITERVGIPTIGIGAGKECDGQVQVFHDMLGLFTDFVPKHAKQYANLGETISSAVSEYISEVIDQSFPSREHIYHIKEEILAELQAQVR